MERGPKELKGRRNDASEFKTKRIEGGKRGKRSVFEGREEAR